MEKDTTEKLVEFKTNNFINEHENYKYAVLEQAKNSLLTKTWKEDEIGNGRILKSVKDSIQTNVIYNYETHQKTNSISKNNLNCFDSLSELSCLS